MPESTSRDSNLLELARQAGLAPTWEDAHGHRHAVNPDVLRTLLAALDLPADSAADVHDSLHRLQTDLARHHGPLVVGQANRPISLSAAAGTRYTLTLENGQQLSGTLEPASSGDGLLSPIAQIGYHTLLMQDRQITLAIAPPCCPSVEAVAATTRPRLWGVSAQLYSLRRGRQNDPAQATGFGDFAALAALARHAAHHGASAVAISPVHALFAANPHDYSPYAPSSRLFLNALYASPELVLSEHAVAQARNALNLDEALVRTDARSTIDWPAAAGMRMQLFRQLFNGFQSRASSLERQALAHFRHAGGEALENHARFEALHAHYSTLPGAENGWQYWPEPLRDPAGPAVQAFAEQHPNEIEFHVFLQWLASQSLKHVQHSACNAGMPIGLITDLAIGTDPRGSHAWSRQAEILTDVTAGAPPDLYNPLGQNWHLTAFSPLALQAGGYSAYLEMLRAALDYSGGIRIDHALGLHRLWLVPKGASPADGAYLHYPQAQLSQLIALEAWRHQALVIGENLGTVPAGFNAQLEHTGILGISVLWFEREDTPPPDAAQAPAFLPPEQWSPCEVAMTTTHDLATVRGWWQGRDLDWRIGLNLIGPDENESMLRARREHDKNRLWQALCDAGCVLSIDPQPPVQAPLEALLNFVARSPSPLALIPLEDLLGLTEQPNLPGTDGTHPNWVQRLAITASRLFDDEQVRRSVDAITQGREAS